uniref:Uncharacterized protein n=1 Tax=Romanomermis culicivorax TaxID=13658 RepID=A0A915LDN5_ROMCU
MTKRPFCNLINYVIGGRFVDPEHVVFECSNSNFHSDFDQIQFIVKQLQPTPM